MFFYLKFFKHKIAVVFPSWFSEILANIMAPERVDRMNIWYVGCTLSSFQIFPRTWASRLNSKLWYHYIVLNFGIEFSDYYLKCWSTATKTTTTSKKFSFLVPPSHVIITSTYMWICENLYIWPIGSRLSNKKNWHLKNLNSHINQLQSRFGGSISVECYKKQSFFYQRSTRHTWQNFPWEEKFDFKNIFSKKLEWAYWCS